MNELNDRVYKFVLVGRIFFFSMILITAILTTVTASNAANSSYIATLEDPNISFISEKNDKSDVDIPIVGDTTTNDDIDIASQTAGDENIDSDEKSIEESQISSPTPDSIPNTDQFPTQPIYNTSAYSEPATPKSNPIYLDDNLKNQPIDYSQITLIDGEEPEATIIPVIPNSSESEK